MQWGYREKMATACAGLVLAIIGWYLLYYDAQLQRIGEIQASVARIEQEIAQAQGAAGSIVQLEQRITEVRQEVAAERRRIPPKDQLLEIAERVRQGAEAAGLVVDRSQFARDVLFSADAPGGIIKLPLSLWVRGEFFNLGQFLESLGDLPFLMKPGELRISTDDDRYPELEIFLVAYAYVMP